MNKPKPPAMTLAEHVAHCGESLRKNDGAGTPWAWCPKCGALYMDGQMIVPDILKALTALAKFATDDDVRAFPQTGQVVAAMVEFIHDCLDSERISHKVVLEHYARLFAETEKLRERRDGLLAHNNQLVARIRVLANAVVPHPVMYWVALYGSGNGPEVFRASSYAEVEEWIGKQAEPLQYTVSMAPKI